MKHGTQRWVLVVLMLFGFVSNTYGFNWWGFDDLWRRAVGSEPTVYTVTDNGGEAFVVTDNGGEDYEVR
jgi:hypothetical protein